MAVRLWKKCAGPKKSMEHTSRGCYGRKDWEKMLRTGGNFLRVCFAMVALVLLLHHAPAHSFPPYRSTDAGTADPGTVEIRVGAAMEREDHDNTYAAPLLNLNLGLPRHFELVSEFEYQLEDERISIAAGVKWAQPMTQSLSIGIETLALLPVSSRDENGGIESQLLATISRDSFLLHLNAGGFYDARPVEEEHGWRASILAEMQKRRITMGAELFAKKVSSEPTKAQAGLGIIVDAGSFDVRAGVHVGLTRDAPDIAANLWVTWKWPVFDVR